MKVGNLVRHNDGAVGVVIEIRRGPDWLYPYRIRWFDGDTDWFRERAVELISESR